MLTGVVANRRYLNSQRFLTAACNLVLAYVRKNLDRHNCVKVNTMFDGKFTNKDTKHESKTIITKNCQLLLLSDLRKWYDSKVFEHAELNDFEGSKSGWVLSKISSLMDNINKCNPMRAVCWIDLSAFIKYKRAVINIQSFDNACFAWSVVAALFPDNKHPKSVKLSTLIWPCCNGRV